MVLARCKFLLPAVGDGAVFAGVGVGGGVGEGVYVAADGLTNAVEFGKALFDRGTGFGACVCGVVGGHGCGFDVCM